MKPASRTFGLLKDGKPVGIKAPQLKLKSLRNEIQERRQVTQFGYTLLTHSEPINTVESYLQSAFPGCIYEAYKGHLHLVMRPDDVWIGLMSVFSNFVSQHSEKLKDLFKPMDVIAVSSIEDVSTKPLVDWMKMIENLVREIPISNEIKTAMVPDFSTTTDLDRAVGGLCLLGGMKKFAKYGFLGACGIPKVTLEGTSDDWGLLLKKIEFLTKLQFKLVWKNSVGGPICCAPFCKTFSILTMGMWIRIGGRNVFMWVTFAVLVSKAGLWHSLRGKVECGALIIQMTLD